MKRREWMRQASAAVLALLGVDWLASCSSQEDDAQGSSARQGTSALDHVLRDHFAYLDFDERVLAAFVRDHEAQYGPFRGAPGRGPFTRFLASTDFFQNGADESRALRYVAYYDPYVSPCYNPFTAGPASL